MIIKNRYIIKYYIDQIINNNFNFLLRVIKKERTLN